MSRTFNEATRVQMPAMVHLCRLGYHFYGKIHQDTEGTKYDGKTNILLNVFRTKFEALNPKHIKEFDSILAKIQEELDYDDLGKAFYKRLTSVSPIRLIDFDNPKNNDYHFTAEFTCKNGDNEFRPDITLFVNGLPLVFVEVKKPNNAGGMLAESRRMNEDRFPNRAFRRFINITQLMIFSNNMEYDNRGGVIPVEGAFYCTGGRKNVPFNCFREQKKSNEDIADYILNRPLPDEGVFDKTEEWILKEYNNQVIVHDPEYKENKKVTTPTNRILTSMCSPERLLFLLKYGIVYVKQEKEDEDGKLIVRDEKHIMRYQQFFAAMDIRRKLSEGVKSGIVWHTQGSGKTALSYYLTKVLTDYYASINTVAKFYFIVDRLDLLTQATQEFEARGLDVHTANSKDELMAQFNSHQSLEGNTGQMEITVVNIQKFAPTDHVTLPQYATRLQRIFIMDEAHRGYKPGGCFLANLFDADQDSVKIALTGTPLLAEERSSCKVFGEYLSTYYYDRSIADGYTRRIIREDIETSYREKLNAVYDKLDGLIQKKDVKKDMVIENTAYTDELLRYIIHDMARFRSGYPNLNPGGMVICETSKQARLLYERFEQIQNEHNDKFILKAHFKAGLVLYDSDSKEGIKQTIKDFKKNETLDILFVFNMLLTGFDAPRLKRLYFCRQMDGHNLLQAITRVNRPYYDMRYGYLIDFANIKKNFEETNEAYLRELARVDDPDAPEEETLVHTFQSVMASQEEIIEQMRQIRNQLYDFTLDNAEIFSDQISTMEDKGVLLELKEALQSVRDMSNMVRTFGDEDLRRKFAELDISKLPDLLSEVQHRINLINARESFEVDADKRVMINEAMAEIEFNFSKVGEEELSMASKEELHNIYADVIRELSNYVDMEDPEFITIREAFRKRFHEYGFEIDTMAKYTEQKKQLDEIMHRLRQLKMKNDALAYKYNGDYKYARIHKRIREQNIERQKNNQEPIAKADDLMIEMALKAIKNSVDEVVYNQAQVLKKDKYFTQTVQHLVSTTTKAIINLHITPQDWEFITPRICKQYEDQYNQTYPN